MAKERNKPNPCKSKHETIMARLGAGVRGKVCWWCGGKKFKSADDGIVSHFICQTCGLLNVIGGGGGAAASPPTVMGYTIHDLEMVASILRANGITPRDLKRAADNFEEAARITRQLMAQELDKAMATFCAAHNQNGGNI